MEQLKAIFCLICVGSFAVLSICTLTMTVCTVVMDIQRRKEEKKKAAESRQPDEN